jgi:hypothetical protein
MKVDINTPIEIDSFYMGMNDYYWEQGEDEVDYPRRLHLDKIDNIIFDQIDYKDAPDFCDAYILSADMNGIEMNEEELDSLNENSGFVYQKLIDYLY